jgi:hypothetical protein
VSLIIANEFSMRYDLMLFSYRIYTTRFLQDYFLWDIFLRIKHVYRKFSYRI